MHCALGRRDCRGRCGLRRFSVVLRAVWVLSVDHTQSSSLPPCCLIPGQTDTGRESQESTEASGSESASLGNCFILCVQGYSVPELSRIAFIWFFKTLTVCSLRISLSFRVPGSVVRCGYLWHVHANLVAGGIGSGAHLMHPTDLHFPVQSERAWAQCVTLRSLVVLPEVCAVPFGSTNLDKQDFLVPCACLNLISSGSVYTQAGDKVCSE